ncbi:MAG: histidinol-phosphatase [Sulfuricaulis sp.]
MSLAIFDLDNTLLRGDSDHAWGRFLIENHIVDGEAYERDNERFYAQYQAGTLDIMKFLAFALEPLATHDRAILERWHQRYMQTKILPMITSEARALVDKHRARGDTLLIITATNRFITAPIAREFNIPNLLATEPEESNGRFTGQVSGTPCYRDGKVTRLRSWMQEHNQTLLGSWFYSDSHNDLPLLSIVDHPVVVNPDDTLKCEALKRRWPILHLG